MGNTAADRGHICRSSFGHLKRDCADFQSLSGSHYPWADECPWRMRVELAGPELGSQNRASCSKSDEKYFQVHRDFSSHNIRVESFAGKME